MPMREGGGQATSPAASPEEGSQPNLASRFGIGDAVLEQAFGESGAPEPQLETDPTEEPIEAGVDPTEPTEGEEGGGEVGEGEGEQGDPQPNTDPETILHKVTVDGNEVEATLQELKSNYSFRGYLTQESQRLQEKHRTAMGGVEELQGTYLGKLQQADKILQAINPSEPDWENMEPEQIPEAMKRYQAQSRVVKSIQEEIAQESQQGQVAQQHAFEAQQHQEEAMLLTALPGWTDHTTRQKESIEIAQFAHNLIGYTPDEVKIAGYDHRNIMLMRYAMLGYQAEQAARGLRSGAHKTPKAGPAGNTNLGKTARHKATDAELQKRAGATGRQGDAAALLRHRHGSWMGLD